MKDDRQQLFQEEDLLPNNPQPNPKAAPLCAALQVVNDCGARFHCREPLHLNGPSWVPQGRGSQDVGLKERSTLSRFKGQKLHSTKEGFRDEFLAELLLTP
ncbi:hypothetical protein PAAG_11745 [Paracoccidioides lutzii Pb01]|uniref:Uncharacterized protein n=1 Tax=Paracoccidioides lutzii (strain ATCC MYA-826 / Pb01) TaxID=502779 RepID=A0A0A2V5T7_PARBA|nr:hypothetical protein PAAG_11745 [Paracoccidioides lutzii Pb01]KGQ01510.1 hypothetical protein PAAG_11745 [Paracoccidioides lutzii Pb01]